MRLVVYVTNCTLFRANRIGRHLDLYQLISPRVRRRCYNSSLRGRATVRSHRCWGSVKKQLRITSPTSSIRPTVKTAQLQQPSPFVTESPNVLSCCSILDCGYFFLSPLLLDYVAWSGFPGTTWESYRRG